MNSHIRRLASMGLTASLLCQSALAQSSYRLNKVWGGDSALTALSVNQFALEDTDKAYMVSNQDFADALVAGVMAGEEGAAILYTDGKKMDRQTEEAMKSYDEIVAVGGDKAVPKGDYQKRIFGKNRYETAVEVAKKLGTKRNIIIVNGENFADTLSAISMAAEEDRVILYVDSDQIPKETADYIRNYGKDKDIVFLGGNKAIKDSVKEDVLKIAGSKKKVSQATIGGKNRYETSQMIANRMKDPQAIIFASGKNFTDALAASGLVGEKKAPVILVDDVGDIDVEKMHFSTKNYYVVGSCLDENEGRALVSSITGQAADNITYEENFLDKEETPKLETVSLVEEKEKIEEPKLVEEPGNVDLNGRKAINMEATAYDASVESNGSWGPVTAMGTNLRPGVVAVDPKVIPLGTKLYIASTDGSPDYGYAVAEDTGGAIKGNKIDLFFEKTDDVWSFGRRNVKVYVLD